KWRRCGTASVATAATTSGRSCSSTTVVDSCSSCSRIRNPAPRSREALTRWTARWNSISPAVPLLRSLPCPGVREKVFDLRRHSPIPLTFHSHRRRISWRALRPRRPLGAPLDA
ncbi:hypothetical protein PFISCL1PPCAC_9241, partial [Pristionchus fissidentatus]